jgi:biotin operon repressor
VALVHTHPGRPVYVMAGTCRVYISVHDDEYRRQRARWRQRLAEAHPDRSGTRRTFEKLHAQYVAWQDAEEEWYAQYGLRPPGRGVALDVADPVVASLDTRWRTRVLLALDVPRTRTDVARLLGVPPNTAGVMVHRLRREGAPIIVESAGHREWHYVLTEPWTPPLTASRDRLLAALQSQPRTVAELMALLGISRSGVHIAVARLRRQGYPIVTRETAEGSVYTLAQPAAA